MLILHDEYLGYREHKLSCELSITSHICPNHRHDGYVYILP